MKAWQVGALGEPAEVMRLADVPDPEPGPGQLAVRVLASPANFPDVPTVDEATGHKWHKGVWRAIVGPKGIANGEVEVKRRATGERQTLSLDAALNKLVSP